MSKPWLFLVWKCPKFAVISQTSQPFYCSVYPHCAVLWYGRVPEWCSLLRGWHGRRGLNHRHPGWPAAGPHRPILPPLQVTGVSAGPHRPILPPLQVTGDTTSSQVTGVSAGTHRPILPPLQVTGVSAGPHNPILPPIQVTGVSFRQVKKDKD